MKILLNYNPTTNVETYWEDNVGDDYQCVIETKQRNLDSIADYCKEVRENNKFKGYGDGGGFDYKIPAAVAGVLMREGKLFDQEYMAKWKKEHPEYSLYGGSKYFEVKK